MGSPINLINGKLYTHPLTRNLGKPSRIAISEEGNTYELPGTPPTPKNVLTDLDIVQYYYQSIGVPKNSPLANRDCGSIRWTVDKYGLDKTLFAVDALIDSHLNGENRSNIPPNLIECANYIYQGELRYNEVIAVARQYKVSAC